MKTRTKVVGAVIGPVICAVVLFVLLPMFLRFPIRPGALSPFESLHHGHAGAGHGGHGAAGTHSGLDAVDRKLAKLGFGNIAYNVPKRMNIRDTAVIQLKLSLKTSIDELERMIEATGEKRGERIKVSDRMEAQLDSSDFAIIPIGDKIQAVSRNDITKWEWEVKPISEGRHFLHLTVSVLLLVENTSTPKAVCTFDKMIEVQVTGLQRVGMFFEKNWQWVWTVIFVPIVAWLWQRKRGVKANVSRSDG